MEKQKEIFSKMIYEAIKYADKHYGGRPIVNGAYTKLMADHLLAEGIIVPPVKIGQKLFVLEDIGIQTLPEIIPLTVYNLAFTVFEEGIKTHIVCITDRRKVRHIKDEDFGNTVFLTREEAEKALAERSKK